MTQQTSSNKQDWRYFAKSFVAGGLAGMTSKTIVAPLDRTKILLQVHNNHYRNHGVFRCLIAIVKNESFLSLYKGNGAQMVRIFPYAAVQFASFEVYKSFLTQMFTPAPIIIDNSSSANHLQANRSNNVNHELKFVAGSMAGVTSVLMTYPLDLVRARLAAVVNTKSNIKATSNANAAPTTILGTLVSVFRNEGGLAGLYRGITPTILAMIPYGGCNFYMFERLKYCCVNYAPTYTCYTATNDKLVLNVPSKLLCGAVAGSIGQTLIYPLDVARRRMQLAMTSRETAIYSESFVQALILTWRNYGVISGLYRGMSVNYIRAVPMVAVSFCTYELLKQLFGLETGV